MKELRLNELVAANHWINGKITECLLNKKHRFGMYGWYAKNIYHTCGLGNWQDLFVVLFNFILRYIYI